MNIAERVKNALASDAAKNALRGTVQQVAPKVAGALSGPAGPIAEGVVRRISQDLLGRPDAPAAELEERLGSMSPEDAAKIMQLERELEIESERIAMEDRANARQREIETGDKFPMYFAMGVSVSFFGYLVLLVFVAPPEASASIVYAGAGTLGTAFIATVTYFFGSSRGSKIKDAIMTRFRQ